MNVNVEYYAESTSRSQEAKAMMSCNKCGIKNLQTHYNFCPNCGVEFQKDDILIIKETIRPADVGNIIDLFA